MKDLGLTECVTVTASFVTKMALSTKEIGKKEWSGATVEWLTPQETTTKATGKTTRGMATELCFGSQVMRSTPETGLRTYKVGSARTFGSTREVQINFSGIDMLGIGKTDSAMAKELSTIRMAVSMRVTGFKISKRVTGYLPLKTVQSTKVLSSRIEW